MRWLLALSFLVLAEATTTTIKEKIKVGKKTFSCSFTLVHTANSVNIGRSSVACSPKKPKGKQANVELEKDGIVFVGKIKINPSKIISMVIEAPTTTTEDTTTEASTTEATTTDSGTTFEGTTEEGTTGTEDTTTWEGTTEPVAGNFSAEEVEFKEIYANVSSDTQQLYRHGCGIDNFEDNIRKSLNHRSYTNMLSTQFWKDGKINWNFVSVGDEYKEHAVYTDTDFGMTKGDVDTAMAAMKHISEKTCIKFERVKPTKGAPWLLLLRDARASDRACQLTKIQALVDKDIAGLGNIFNIMRYAGNQCFPGAYAWYGAASPQLFVISQVPSLNNQNQEDIGLLAHELLHNLGLGHTQKRQDASQHIDIKWENIEKANYAQYEPCVEAKNAACVRYNAYGTKYDCGSIMHYLDTFFLTSAARAAGKKTMIAKNPATCKLDASHSKLSVEDISILNKMYCKNAVPSGTTGEVKSPNYPQNYPVSKDEEYTISVASGSVIELTFTAFQIEADASCGYDWVQVVDGDNSVLMAKKCGTTVPGKVTSKTNKMIVKFRSDSSVVMTGFRATWKKVTAKPQPVDGKWSDWKGWSSCTNSKDGKSTCKKTKTRFCNNPAASNGGKACEGSSTQTEACTTSDLAKPSDHPNCVVHGAWTVWSAASACSSDCKTTKTRTCTNPSPINDNDKCSGDATSTR
jgi:hypothetical protein